MVVMKAEKVKANLLVLLEDTLQETNVTFATRS